MGLILPPGPAFETPAEISPKLGADAVGMSVPEAMVANALGLKVGQYHISNLAAGKSAHPLSHEEVAETASKALPNMTKLLANLLPKL